MPVKDTQEQARPISTSATLVEVAPLPLDSLLSPHDSEKGEFEVAPAISPGPRESETEFNEVTLDDDPRFSTVPLTAYRNGTSGSSFELQMGRRRSSSIIISENDSSSTKHSLHKKSLSESSVLSGNNLPFILARLDAQKALDAHDPKSHRISVDGQLKLKEEFVRLQSGRLEEVENAAHATIDWGMLLISRHACA